MLCEWPLWTIYSHQYCQEDTWGQGFPQVKTLIYSFLIVQNATVCLVTQLLSIQYIIKYICWTILGVCTEVWIWVINKSPTHLVFRGTASSVKQPRAWEVNWAEELDPENTLTNAIANGGGWTLIGEHTWTSCRGRGRLLCENESDAMGMYEQADYTEGDQARKLIEGNKESQMPKGKLIRCVDPRKAVAAKMGRCHHKYCKVSPTLAAGKI